LLLDPVAEAGLPRRHVYYGWPMLAGLSIAETVSWGIVYYAFSVFIRPMEIELGWSRAQVTGAFSLALLVGGIAAVPVGHWLDAHGPRALMTAGSVAAVVLLIAWSRVESLVGFYLVWMGLGLAMAAVLYEPAFAIVAAWFVRHRHRALTILTVCAGLASTIFVPLAGWLLVRQGWRSAVVTLAAILAATTVPIHALLLRRSPQAIGVGVDGDERKSYLPPWPRRRLRRHARRRRSAQRSGAARSGSSPRPSCSAAWPRWRPSST
jgi:MFS family permease